MKIGIDIDDTTFLTVKSMLKYADIFEEEISGVPGTVDTKNSCILKPISELDNFYIEENYRGQGIGTKLVNEFKKYCLDKGK